MNYPEYVIPSPSKLWDAAQASWRPYTLATIKTFVLVISGHLIAVVMAFLVALVVVTRQRVGSYVRSVAYTLQAYPLVAVAPMFFILFGDGLVTQLLITVTICYFPVLLTILGVLMSPVPEVEHFYTLNRSLTLSRVVKIRLSENAQAVQTAVTGSASLAVVGAILAEYLAEYSGIGFYIWMANNSNQLDGILLALLTIGCANWIYLSIVEMVGSQAVRKLNKVKESTK
ncbi:MAG: ABC transporter permease subunit [Candidatus Contendobacter sp.]|nr:ABC transporter permease subunit [Candidatus Contendobacter sp.]MDG4557957.1 ABC transporter permease subunit [Candidatus Contendobacter sp.]